MTVDNPIVLRNASRHRNQYGADLYVYGVRVGRVEKGFVQGGFDAGKYKATVDGITVASARRLTDLRDDLREWIMEERQMEHDAVWVRKKREQ